jgi:hypothetical protein
MSHIPNFNTISTIIDRLTVEIVKKTHFEFLVETGTNDASLIGKIQLQDEMIQGLKKHLAEALRSAIEKGEYSFIDETRTFG